MLYFDSSALLKLFVAESGSAEMIGLFDATPRGEICVSALAGVEVRSAIRRRQRNDDFPPFQAQEFVTLLNLSLSEIQVVPVDNIVLTRAATLIDRSSLRTLDAIQLATALTQRESALAENRFAFVCADARLLAAAEREGLALIAPRQP